MDPIFQTSFGVGKGHDGFLNHVLSNTALSGWDWGTWHLDSWCFILTSQFYPRNWEDTASFLKRESNPLRGLIKKGFKIGANKTGLSILTVFFFFFFLNLSSILKRHCFSLSPWTGNPTFNTHMGHIPNSNNSNNSPTPLWLQSRRTDLTAARLTTPLLSFQLCSPLTWELLGRIHSPSLKSLAWLSFKSEKDKVFFCFCFFF